MSHLKDVLPRYGWTGQPLEFKVLLKETLELIFPGRTVDDVLVKPYDALSYCSTVRDRSDCNFPDEFILRQLINFRKTGNFNLVG